jgi:hypothetical protein
VARPSSEAALAPQRSHTNSVRVASLSRGPQADSFHQIAEAVGDGPGHLSKRLIRSGASRAPGEKVSTTSLVRMGRPRRFSQYLRARGRSCPKEPKLRA